MLNRLSSQTAAATLPVAFGLPIAAALLSATTSSFTRWSVVAGFAALCAVVLLGFFALTREKLPRAPVAASITVLPWLLVTGWCVVDKLTTPLVHAPVTGMRCGTGIMMLLMLVVPVGFIIVLGASILLAFAGHERWFDRPVRRAAEICLILAVLASAFSLPKSFKPDADTYFRSLTVVGTMKLGQSMTVAGRKLEYVERDLPSSPPVEGDPLAVEGAPTPFPPKECHVEGVLTPFTSSALYNGERCPELEVRIDPAGDYAFLFYRGAPWGDGVQVAYRTTDFEAVDITQKVLGSRIAAPIGWRIGAYGAALLSFILLFIARRIATRAARSPEQPAHHRGEGWCSLPNVETPIRVPAAVALPSGPVLLGGAGDVAPGYRDAGGISFTTARSGEEHKTSDLVSGLRAIALTIAAFGSSPLILARFFGV